MGKRLSSFFTSPFSPFTFLASAPSVFSAPSVAVKRSFLVSRFSLLLILFSACTGNRVAEQGLTAVPMRYATNLTCERGEGYSLWTLRDPWDSTAVLHRYVLVHDSAAVPDFSLFTFQLSTFPPAQQA